MCEWTPPWETSPSRWTSPPRSRARSNAATSCGLSKKAPSAIARLTRWRSWSSTRPEPIVRWPTSEFPIWPGGRPTAAPDAPSVVCGNVAQRPVEHRRVGELDGVPRPGRGAAPAVEDDERYEREDAAARHIEANDSTVEGCAADERAVDVGLRQQLRGVLGLDRAAVEHRTVEQRLDERVRVLRHLGRRRQAGADRPDRLVGEHEAVVRAARLAERLTCARSTASVSPASRSLLASRRRRRSRRRPASSAASARRATSTSVSPKYCRRSECPTIAPRTPSRDEHRRGDLARERALGFPVDVLRERHETGARRSATRPVYGGQTIASTPSTPASALAERQRVRAREHLPVAGDDHAGDSPAGESRRRRAAPCPRAARGSAPPPVETQETRPRARARSTRARSRAPPTTESASRVRGDRLGDGPRPAREARPFEDAHRAVPEDRPARRRSRSREARARLRADVEAEPAVRQVVVAVDGRTRPPRRTPRPRRRRPAARPGNGSGFSARSCSAILPPIEHRVGAAAEVPAARRACPRPSRRRRRARTAARRRRAARRGARARRAAAGRRTPAAAARRLRSTRARGARSRTRR